MTTSMNNLQTGCALWRPQVKVSQQNSVNEELVTVKTLSKGDWFGEQALKGWITRTNYEFLSQSHYSLQSRCVKSTMKFCRKTQRCLKLIIVHHRCTTMAQLASDSSCLCFPCREDVRIASYTAVGDVTCLVIDREWEGLFVSTINRFLHGGQVSWKRRLYALTHLCFSQVF